MKESSRGLAVAAYLVVVLWGISVARPFLVPLLLASLLAFLAAPMVRTMAARGFPDWLAIAVSSFVLVLPFIFAGGFLLRQAQSLIQDYPKIMSGMSDAVQHFSTTWWGQKLNLTQRLSLTSVTEHLASGAGEGIQVVFHSVKTLLEAGTELVLILLFALFMLASRKHLKRSAERILAQIESIHAAKMVDAVASLIERFLLTKLLVAAIVGVAASLALVCFGIEYGVLLGAFVGILTFIPEVGFFVSLVPIATVAIATGHSLGAILGVLGVNLIIHLIEANLLTPKLVGEKLNLNVLATFIGLFGGGLLWGVWGMFLSVPILGVLRIALSVSPQMEAWGDLLAEKEDRRLTLNLLRRNKNLVTSPLES